MTKGSKKKRKKLDSGFKGVQIRRLSQVEKEVSIFPKSDLMYYDSQSPDFVYNLFNEPVDRVLDIGCGIGKLGQKLKADGVKEVIGIEFNPEAAKIAEKHLDQVHTGDIEELDLLCPPGYFDAIVYSGVLEHLIDPYAELARRRRLLHDGGIVIALLPNVQHFSVILELLAGHWTLQSAGQLDATHYRWFTLHEIVKMFAATGFSIEDIVGNVFDKYPPVYQKMIDLLKPLNLFNPDFEKTTGVYIYTLRARHLPNWQPSSQHSALTVPSSEPQSEILFTGERAMPLARNMDKQVMLEHWARYQYVTKLTKGKCILDIACGTGYGTDLLAQNAERVIGGDIDPETIKYCKSNYQRSNLHFGIMDIRNLPYSDKSFDLVISFETIEHIVEGDQFLREITRILKDDGILVISTPFGGPTGNPYHKAYFQRGTFKDYLFTFFENVQLLFQQVDQIQSNSISPNYAPTFTGEYGLAICHKPKKRVKSLTSIIILTHNQIEHTRNCLESIKKFTPEPHELMIVDNGSTDATLDYLKDYLQSHQNVTVIENKENRGFPAGNNQGLSLVKGDFVLFLNNDTIVTEGWLSKMLRVFERYPEIGILGPVSNYVSGPQLVKNLTYKGIDEMHKFARDWAKKHNNEIEKNDRIVGFCLLAKREIFDKIGGLDESFGNGNFEDDDLCIRADMSGFKGAIVKDVFIHHSGNQTFKGANIDYKKSMQKNWQVLKKKWNLPFDLPMNADYTITHNSNDLSKYYIPFSFERNLSDFKSENGCRLWREFDGKNRQVIEANIIKGETLFDEGQFDEAETVLLDILKTDDKNSRALNNYACLLWKTNRFEKAAEQFKKAIEIAPDDRDVVWNVGQFFLTIGCFDEVKDIYHSYLEKHPEENEIEQTLEKVKEMENVEAVEVL